MIEEKNSLDAHECFEYTERPRGKKVIPVHWIYSVKVDDAHGNVYSGTRLALLHKDVVKFRVLMWTRSSLPQVALGPDVFFCAKAAARGLWKCIKLDIKTAFLNGDLEEEVYVTQPPGFHNGGRQVCRLT
jgi:hypothetical protein